MPLDHLALLGRARVSNLLFALLLGFFELFQHGINPCHFLILHPRIQVFLLLTELSDDFSKLYVVCVRVAQLDIPSIELLLQLSFLRFVLILNFFFDFRLLDLLRASDRLLDFGELFPLDLFKFFELLGDTPLSISLPFLAFL